MRNWSAYRWGEAAVAALLLALGVYLVAAASGMPAGSLAQPGPAAAPFAIGVLLVGVAGGLLARLGIRDFGAEAQPLGREAAITIAVLVAAAIAYEPAGALPTFTVMLAVLFTTLTKGAWWKALLFGVAGATVAWAVFVRLLGVNLPGPGF